MADNRGQSGVRSLLAKFENNNSSTATSPPSRGRSPAGSEQSASGRPLSKVRASFVAVERSGQSGPLLGLRKVNGADESPGKLKTGVSPDDIGSSLERTFTGSSIESGDKGLLDKNLTSSPHTSRSVRTGDDLATDTPTIDTKKATTDVGAPPPIGKFTAGDTPELGKILKGSSFEKSPQRATKKADATNTASLAPEDSPSKSRGTRQAANANANANGKSKDPAPAPKATVPAATKKVTNRPSNISLNKDASANKAASKPSPTKAKSPINSRTPRTPTTQNASKTSSARPSVPKAADKDTAKVPTKKPSRMSLNPTNKATAKSQSSLPAKDTAPKQTTSTTTATKTKSRTKSPTRPVNLPASMTAPTASSAARLGPGGGTSSRASSRAGTATTTLNRKPSSLKPDRATGTTSTRTSTVRKQPSRVSLSPQRSRAQDRPGSSVSNSRAKSPDEGFLARMMRPTASSANKTHERVEPKTPPKVARPPRKITSRASGRSSVEPAAEMKVAQPTAVSDKTPSIREPTPEETAGQAPESAPEPTKGDIPEPPAVLVPDETAEPAAATTEPVEPAPEPVEATPERIEATPERIEATSEPIEATPETIEAAPEPAETAAEPVEAAPEPVDALKSVQSVAEEPAPEEFATEESEASIVEKTEY